MNCEILFYLFLFQMSSTSSPCPRVKGVRVGSHGSSAGPSVPFTRSRSLTAEKSAGAAGTPSPSSCALFGSASSPTSSTGWWPSLVRGIEDYGFNAWASALFLISEVLASSVEIKNVAPEAQKTTYKANVHLYDLAQNLLQCAGQKSGHLVWPIDVIKGRVPSYGKSIRVRERNLSFLFFSHLYNPATRLGFGSMTSTGRTK